MHFSADGELIGFYGAEHPVILKSASTLSSIRKNALAHSDWQGTFFSIDMPGFNYPEDVYVEDFSPPACSWKPINETIFLISTQILWLQNPSAENYWVYDLIPGSAVEEHWSLALIEIHDSPKHFHRIEREQFIVVNGYSTSRSMEYLAFCMSANLWRSSLAWSINSSPPMPTRTRLML